MMSAANGLSIIPTSAATATATAASAGSTTNDSNDLINDNNDKSVNGVSTGTNDNNNKQQQQQQQQNVTIQNGTTTLSSTHQLSKKESSMIIDSLLSSSSSNINNQEVQGMLCNDENGLCVSIKYNDKLQKVQQQQQHQEQNSTSIPLMFTPNNAGMYTSLTCLANQLEGLYDSNDNNDYHHHHQHEFPGTATVPNSNAQQQQKQDKFSQNNTNYDNNYDSNEYIDTDNYQEGNDDLQQYRYSGNGSNEEEHHYQHFHHDTNESKPLITIETTSCTILVKESSVTGHTVAIQLPSSSPSLNNIMG